MMRIGKARMSICRTSFFSSETRCYCERCCNTSGMLLRISEASICAISSSFLMDFLSGSMMVR